MHTKAVSITDPRSRYALNRKGVANYSYSTNYLIDIANNIIVDTAYGCAKLLTCTVGKGIALIHPYGIN